MLCDLPLVIKDVLFPIAVLVGGELLRVRYVEIDSVLHNFQPCKLLAKKGSINLV